MKKIGVTKISDHSRAVIKFRTSYPDDSGTAIVTDHPNEKAARKEFKRISQEYGDAHLIIALVSNNKNQKDIDAEVIDSFYDSDIAEGF